MASNGLLDQNERLRAAIVAEEREKFQSEKVKNAVVFVPAQGHKQGHKQGYKGGNNAAKLDVECAT